ncbi:MAG: gluconeogenesis factor YvcK family protein [Patescibacteria group bacterium]
MKNFKITVIGGGTGTFVVLRGLKNYPVDLTAIITVTDSGGSTGRLRSEFGFLPVGDLRQCLAALADDDNEALIKLLTYRFNKGRGIKGHNLGNLILTGLRDIFGSEPKALEHAASLFRINGNVLPVSLSQATLGAVYENGKKLIGEHEIDQPSFGGGLRVRRIFLRPEISLYAKAAKAIEDSDLIVLGPGDIYTSTSPCLLVNGMREALNKSRGQLVYIVNLMNRYSQTHNFKVSDYISEIEKYACRPVDVAVVNTGKIPAKFLKFYLKERATIPLDDLAENEKVHVIRGDFARRQLIEKVAGDKLQRSYLRHDEDKLARALIKILL